MSRDFWTWLHLTGESVDQAELGLIAEARRLADESGGGGVTVAAVCPQAGGAPEGLADQLSALGADRVLCLVSPHLAAYQGDIFARALDQVMRGSTPAPAALLMAHGPRSADLAGRLGALHGCPVITRACDAHWDGPDGLRARRPIANGYLFETVEALGQASAVLTFLPEVLADPRPMERTRAEVRTVILDLEPDPRDARLEQTIPADPETLDIEQAEIVVAGGRGVGRDEAFEVVFRLALALGGAVAGTRPVIDWHTLPFERQIGQTGKAVSPRLIINCGISGANEYTAGMEKSQLVVAINTDPRARIFRFADLGVVGNLHAVLPLLVQKLEEAAGQGED